MNYEAFIKLFNTGFDPCSSSLGIRLLSAGAGTAEAVLSVSPLCHNPVGLLHGGALTTLADVAAGCAVLRHERLLVTRSLSMHFIKGKREGTVRAVAKELHAGGRTAMVRVDMFDENGALCAACTADMYLLDQPHPFMDLLKNGSTE